MISEYSKNGLIEKLKWEIERMLTGEPIESEELELFFNDCALFCTVTVGYSEIGGQIVLDGQDSGDYRTTQVESIELTNVQFNGKVEGDEYYPTPSEIAMIEQSLMEYF
jgi:hypothetical protein